MLHTFSKNPIFYDFFSETKLSEKPLERDSCILLVWFSFLHDIIFALPKRQKKSKIRILEVKKMSHF